MQRYNEFRLSELYLACRTLGARHSLTHEVLQVLATLKNQDPAFSVFTRDVMNAPATWGESQIIPFRRNPVDLRFACALAACTKTATRQGFIVCSDEALGYIGALGISTGATPYYSLEDAPRVVAVMEEHHVFRALDALALPGITQATVTPDADKPDILHITLPAPLVSEPATQAPTGVPPISAPRKKTTHTLDTFKCRIFPRAAPPELLTQIKFKRVDPHCLEMKIAPEHLMICHHAGLQGLPFELITPDFALQGRFPDMLDSPSPHCLHHTPVGLFHGIFKGLDDELVFMPDDVAYGLRDVIHWLKQTEFAT